MRKPSILFLNRVYPSSCGIKGRGATGRVLRDLAQGFAQEGWDVRVVTSGAKSGAEKDGDVRVIRVKGAEKPKLAGYIWVWFKMLLRALFMKRSDLVVSMSDPPMLVVVGDIVSRIKGMKHIHWCQDVYPDLFPALGVRFPKSLLKWMKRSARKAMGRADKVIVIGRCMARYLGHGGVDTGLMSVVPNWPDFELAQSVAKSAAKNSFDKAPHHGSDPLVDSEAALNRDAIKHYRSHKKQVNSGPKFRVLYAGNLGLAHPVDTILDAAAILCDDNPEIEFVFVGDGPRYEHLAQERGKRHLDNIRLIPYQPAARLRALMESGDVHLISMKDEAQGMLVPSKLYAALAVSRPCILVGAEGSETAKVIIDFKAGHVTPQGDAERLAACIRDLRMNSDQWFAAKAGAAQAGKTFVPKMSIQAWINRAGQVLGDYARPDENEKDIAA